MFYILWKKENQWQKGVMIHRKPRENYFTMIQSEDLKTSFSFVKSNPILNT